MKFVFFLQKKKPDTWTVYVHLCLCTPACLGVRGDKRRGHIEVVLMSNQDICIEAKKNKKKKNKVCKILSLSFIRINGEK